MRWITPLLIAGATLAIFARTLAPTVTAEDSGELITAAYEFGIPHPPGYPLWTMLCGIFMRLIPFGTIALRANLFSAVCSAAAAVVAYAALREVSFSRLPAAAAALCWVWTRWSWMQSVITEVYALNSLLTAAFFWAVLFWYRTRATRPLILASLFAGLAMCNHHQFAFAALAALLWIALIDPRIYRRGRLILSCVAVFALGLLPYIYLPIRAAADPPMNWGNPSTPANFWRHVTRAEYGTVGPTRFNEARSPTRYARQMSYAVASLIDDLTPILAGIGVLGLLLLVRSGRPLLLLAILWLLCNVALFVLVSNYELYRSTRWTMRVFFIPAHIGLIVGIAAALEWLTGKARRLWLVVPICLAAPAVLLTSHFRRNDFSNYWLAHDHAKNLLDCTQPGTMYFGHGDVNLFPLSYMTLVERYRPDVTIANKYGGLDPALYRDRPSNATISPLRWVMSRQPRPFYYSHDEDLPVANAKLIPAGMLYELVSADSTKRNTGMWQRVSYRNLKSSTVRDFGSEFILGAYDYFGAIDALESGDLALAQKRFAAAEKINPEVKELVNSIGAALGRFGHEDLAIQYCRRAAEMDRYYTEPRWNLFQAYEHRGDLASAGTQLEEILAVEPQNPRARAALQRLTLTSTQPAPGGANQ